MRLELQTRLSPLRERVREIQHDLQRTDLSSGDKAVMAARRVLGACHLDQHVWVGRQVFFELREPPKIMRGLRDLVVRRGHPGEIDALHRIDGDPPSLIRQRFLRGDLLFVGQLDGELLCQTWFHRGPQAFDEDTLRWATWDLEQGTFWSYAAAANQLARTSGVFVKVFQTALCSLFNEAGTRRVVCMVKHLNDASMTMHERLGFRRIGIMTHALVPGLKWLRWDDEQEHESWLGLAGAELILPVPPLPPPFSGTLS